VAVLPPRASDTWIIVVRLSPSGGSMSHSNCEGVFASDVSLSTRLRNLNHTATVFSNSSRAHANDRVTNVVFRLCSVPTDFFNDKDDVALLAGKSHNLI